MLKIKKASENDISVIENILGDVAAWLESIGKPLWTKNQIQWENLSKDFVCGDFFIAYFDETPVGCMALVDYDPKFWFDIPKGESLFIHKLAVKREAAGKNISVSLIDYAKTQCLERGIFALRLDCDSKNKKVCELYEKCGFVRVGERCLYGKYYTAFYVCEVAKSQSYTLKYGCNPNQVPARVFMRNSRLPIEIVNGKAGYINLLDALNGWQLVKELKEATGLASAASFKHVSPAGAAVAVPLDKTEKQMYSAQEESYSEIATAYIRARGADSISSYGDFAALSDECDEQTARYISNEISNGIIAPSYSGAALEIFKKYRKGKYIVIQIHKNYEPPQTETRDVYGITFEQARNTVKITAQSLVNVVTRNKIIPKDAALDLLVAQITLKYTQSNSVCYAKNGQTIGIGAGQQSRIHCTRLAGEKADIWRLRSHPNILSLPFLPDIKPFDRNNVIDAVIRCDEYIYTEWQELLYEKPFVMTDEEKNSWIESFTGVSLASDAFFPFGDNIERAYKSGVRFIAQPGGSIRDGNVIEVCDKYGITMALTGIRLFHH